MSIADLFGAADNIRTNKAVMQAALGGQKQGYQVGQTALNTGATQGIGTLEDYLGKSTGAITGGTQQQVGAYQQGMAPWQTIASQSGEFLPTFAGALGLGTPEMVADASQKFTKSPWYDYTLGQGLEGASRVGSQTGQLGAANMDAMKFAQNLSDQDYQAWLGNLFKGVGVNEDAAKATQLGYGNIADTYGAEGSNLAKLFGATGSGIQKIQGDLGNELADLGTSFYTNKGNLMANRLSADQMARMNADQNSLDTMFKVAGLAMAPFTGGASMSLGSIGAPQGSDATGLSAGINRLFGGSGYAPSSGAYDSMMQGSGFMDNAGNIY